MRKLIYHLVDNIWFTVDMKIYGVPIHVAPPHIWWFLWKCPGQRMGFFRKRVHDAYNPKRWGGHILGLEIGSRG